MIVMYKGHRGSGKTLSMVKDGYGFFTRGYKVLRNFDCKFGEYIDNEDILNLDKDSDLYDCVLMIDEIQIFFDNRQSMRKQNIKFSNFIQQIRKRNIIILCTTQYSNTVDLRIKQHIDIVAMPSFNKLRQICIITYMDLTRLQDDPLFQANEELKPMVTRVIFNPQLIYKLYNTGEMIR